VSAHTPGPWKVWEEQRTGGPLVFHLDGHARIASWRRSNEHGRTRDRANARLIAAAPELLAALEDCANELEQS
jgi:tRNA G37 N-methylase TrmD